VPQENFEVLGPGLDWTSDEERIKIRAKKLVFLVGFGGNFG